jgi:O-antigen/teichoic acid export membrane protein
MSVSIDSRIRHFPRGLWTRIREPHSFVGAVARLSSGSALAQCVALLGTPLVTRIYSPQDFTRFGLFLAALGFANAFATLKYDAAIVSAKRACDAIRLVVLSVTASLPLGALATVILYLMVQSSLLGFGNLPTSSILILFPTVVAYSTFAALRQWFVRRSDDRRISRSLVFHSTSRLSSQLTLGFAGATGVGLAISEAIGRISVSVFMARYAWPRLQRAVRTLRWSELLGVASEYSRFPRHATLSTLVDTAATVLPLPLVVQFYGTVSAGAFVLVQRVILIPIALIGLSVADVFHRKLAKTRASDSDEAMRLLDKTALSLLLLGAFPCVSVMLLAPSLMAFVFSEEWASAGEVVQALAPLAWAQFAISPISQCFSVYQAHRFKLIYDVLYLVVSIATIAGASSLGAPFITAVRAFSAANVVAYVVYFFLMRHIVREFHQKP